MKVTLDLDRLLEEGLITREEHSRLAGLASRDTASLALNVLVAFGVTAVAGGALALLQSAEASVLLGAVVGIAGVYLDRARTTWRPLAVVLLLVGALTFGGGVVALTDGSAAGSALLCVAFGVGAVLAGSGLLASLSALALLAASGGATDYSHAAYFLGIEQPSLTVVLFGALSFAAYRAAPLLPPDSRRLATIFSRTCLFIVNLGFWIGSLWGDALGARSDGDALATRAIVVPEWLFAVVWAIGLVAVGVWATRKNLRWVVNLVAVFAAIHFYTQYFENLGASPGTVLAAGVVALGIAAALLRYNKTASVETPEAL